MFYHTAVKLVLVAVLSNDSPVMCSIFNSTYIVGITNFIKETFFNYLIQKT